MGYQQNRHTFPVPDKNIPLSIMIIGTFELGMALLILLFIVMVGTFDRYSLAISILLVIYGASGAGLWAIQEWARVLSILLHVLAIPYVFLTFSWWEAPLAWQPVAQLVIAGSIIIALTRPAIRYKFQTVVPKKR